MATPETPASPPQLDEDRHATAAISRVDSSKPPVATTTGQPARTPMKFKIPLLSLKTDAEVGVLDTRNLRWPPGRGKASVPKVAAVVVRGSNGANLIESYHADVSDGTFFGWMTAGAAEGISRTFSIHNVGTAPLELGPIGLEGTGADQFEWTAAPARVVAPGESTTVTLRFRARRAGSAVALVLLPSNDPTERPYLFLVEGHADAAEAPRRAE